MAQERWPNDMETAVDAISDSDVMGFYQPTTIAGVRKQKKNLITLFREYFQGPKTVYEITTGTDEVHALPDATAHPGEQTIKRRGAGTGKATFTTVSGQKIEDLAASEWALVGTGELILFPYAGNWEVKKYSDKVSTGWVANSDWTDRSFAINHALSAGLSEIDIKFFISTDGTEDNAFEIRKFESNASGVTGFTVFAVDANNVLIRIATGGLYFVNSAGTSQLIDNEAWYYKVVVTIKD